MMVLADNINKNAENFYWILQLHPMAKILDVYIEKVT